MKSADQLNSDNWEGSADATLLPANSVESQHDNKKRSRSRSPTKRYEDEPSPNVRSDEWVAIPGVGDEESKWIHRDKLAKIENEELQAAGLFVPRSRAPSKQRRDRSRSTMRRGASSSEQNQNRSRQNSTAVEQRPMDIVVPSWDLRTAEEIAEEEANAYFTANGLNGSSRIPVAKLSPAPITLDGFDRSAHLVRRKSESPESELTSVKTRSRSASATLSRIERTSATGSLAAKKSQGELSPKKQNTNSRKVSSGTRSTVNSRPKTRSGSTAGTRPSTRSGESPPTKQPEGDPPWLVNSYKPDPRLPPDQQLLPTVARRLQQERWEKEGTFGDVYDTDFRPLNDNVLLKPPSPDKPRAEEPDAEEDTQANQWPLRSETKSPSIRQGAYSTMPKISDNPPLTPMTATGPKPPPSPQMLFQPQIEPQSPAAQRVPQEKPDANNKKSGGGCGCCLVM